ncbi:NUDIX hydrolase domain-like protein [Chytridium lagenaria]|nr:NUDIX hydrolase domain-like protein [Chytridium lagenaria]
MDAHLYPRSYFPIERARWVKLYEINWTDPNGKMQRWESAERTTRKGAVDAVAIFPIIKGGGVQGTRTVLVKQFRPPVAAVAVEMPAGLIDQGESAETAAIRELKEETGFVGKVIRVSPIMVSDPGMSNANMQLVTVEVDLDAPENENATPELEPTEFIERVLTPIDGLLKTLQESVAEGYAVDARLMHFAEGLDVARKTF